MRKVMGGGGVPGVQSRGSFWGTGGYEGTGGPLLGRVGGD